MKKTYKFIAIIVLLFSTFLIGCSSQENTDATNENKPSNEDEKQLKVFTTLYPLADFTKKIGGEHVEVESIIPPGTDAHTFEPTSKQMVQIAESDAFIFNGLGMEAYAEKIKSALENENVIMIAAADGINLAEHGHEDHVAHEEEHGHEEEAAHEDEHGHEEEAAHKDEHGHEEEAAHKDEHGHEEEAAHEDEHGHEEEAAHEDEHGHEEEAAHEDEHGHEEEAAHEDEHGHEEEAAHEDEHEHGELDPHVWLDPYRAILLAENIKNALIQLNPDAHEEFEANYESLKTELEKLDEEFHHIVDEKQNPQILVSHAAYGYWEESYGIQQIAVSGLSPTNEPSQKQLEKIIDVATEENIKYVIFEQNITPKVAEIIRNEINAEPLRLHNLAVLTDEDIQNGEDYFSLMRKNLEVLDQAME